VKNKDNLHQEGPSESEAEKTPSLEQEEVAQAKRSDGGVGNMITTEHVKPIPTETPSATLCSARPS
jgi:hypothetical protein